MNGYEQTNEISVTIKYPEQKKYEGAPWAVFKGSVEQVRAQIVAYFGFDADQVAGMSLHEVVLLAQSSAKNAGMLATTLGAVPVSQESQPEQSGPTGESVWSQVGSNQPAATPPADENPNAGLISLIEGAASLEDLKRLWFDNKAAFDADPKVQDAYKARGKFLKAQAAG